VAWRLPSRRGQDGWCSKCFQIALFQVPRFPPRERVAAVNVNVNVTGVLGTTQLGTATVTADATVNVTGVLGTTQLGTATVTADANVSVTGVVGTTQLGTATVNSRCKC
jgi:hypothetical protein